MRLVPVQLSLQNMRKLESGFQACSVLFCNDALLISATRDPDRKRTAVHDYVTAPPPTPTSARFDRTSRQSKCASLVTHVSSSSLVATYTSPPPDAEGEDPTHFAHWFAILCDRLTKCESMQSHARFIHHLRGASRPPILLHARAEKPYAYGAPHPHPTHRKNSALDPRGPHLSVRKPSPPPTFSVEMTSLIRIA